MAFATNWLLQKNGIHIPVMHAYMDDLICIPVILFPILIIYRKYLVRSEIYVFPLAYILVTCFVLCIVFELWLPKQNTKHIADPLDMVLYALSGVLFWYMQKPLALSKQESQVC